MDFPKGIEGEYLALRYSVKAQGGGNKKLNGSLNLTEAGKIFGFYINSIYWYALPNDIYDIPNPYPDASIVGIKQSFQKENKEKYTVNLNFDEICFFRELLTKDVQEKANEILKNATVFFNSGQFERYNKCFYRYIRNLKEVNDYDLDDMITRHFIASVCLKQYNECKENLHFIMKKPHLFDYNIYIFLMNFFEGNFSDAVTNILNVAKNIPEIIFEKMFKEEEIALYMVIILLVNFNENFYKEVLTKNETLVYKLNELHPEIFELLHSYENCDFEKVIFELEKLKKEKLTNDLILSVFSERIESLIKDNILKEILKICSAVDIKYLCDLFKNQNKIEIEQKIINLIDNESFNISIDDITGIIYCKNKSEIDKTMKKCLITCERNLSKIFDFTFKNALEGKVTVNNFTQNENMEMSNLDEKYYSEDYRKKYGGWNDYPEGP
jgi:hypothetical protein